MSEPVMKLIAGAEVYAPEAQGRMDVLVAGGVVAYVGAGAPEIRGIEVERIDGSGMLLVPGFIDAHVHILGGGGEGGYATRTPEIVLSDLTAAGVTTVVGCLGTDGTTRTMSNLVAKARGLEAEGISTWIYTGSYQVPVRTLTGSVQDDIVLIDKVIGAGEIAMSDHRSSQPGYEELLRIVASARVGGMLSGKAGVVNVHVGDGPRMLALLERIVAETEIPAKHIVPTHMNRNARLLEAGIAWAKAEGGRGRYIDLTTSSVSDDPGRTCGAALRRLLDEGVSIDSISFSSDGQGSLPRFGPGGEYLGLGVGSVDTLFAEVRNAVRGFGVPLELALKPITSTPAAYLGLPAKGCIRAGADADLVLLDRELGIRCVLAKGRVMVRDGAIERLGSFERHLLDSFGRKKLGSSAS
jgi:beta-aspartyl-dipeptidase (metallo-type)